VSHEARALLGVSSGLTLRSGDQQSRRSFPDYGDKGRFVEVSLPLVCRDFAVELDNDLDEKLMKKDRSAQVIEK
jgi:hypothetical protein